MGKAPSHKSEPVRVPSWAKEQDSFSKSKRYPNCKGTFPDCPTEIKEGVVDNECRLCPFFK